MIALVNAIPFLLLLIVGTLFCVVIGVGVEKVFAGASHKLILVALAAGSILFGCMCLVAL